MQQRIRDNQITHFGPKGSFAAIVAAGITCGVEVVAANATAEWRSAASWAVVAAETTSVAGAAMVVIAIETAVGIAADTTIVGVGLGVLIGPVTAATITGVAAVIPIAGRPVTSSEAAIEDVMPEAAVVVMLAEGGVIRAEAVEWLNCNSAVATRATADGVGRLEGAIAAVELDRPADPRGAEGSVDLLMRLTSLWGFGGRWTFFREEVGTG